LTPRRSVSALAPAAGSHEALWEAPDLRDPGEIHHLRPRPHPARFVASPRKGSHFTPPRVIGGGRLPESLDGHPVGALAVCAPGMGSDLEVKVLWGAWSQEPRANRKAPRREDGAEGSGERNRGSTYRNRIEGDADQGERANDREALVTKGKRRRSGDRAGKATVLTRGDLALRLKGRRREAEREVSRGRSSARAQGVKGRTVGRVKRP